MNENLITLELLQERANRLVDLAIAREKKGKPYLIAVFVICQIPLINLFRISFKYLSLGYEASLNSFPNGLIEQFIIDALPMVISSVFGYITIKYLSSKFSANQIIDDFINEISDPQLKQSAII